MKILVTGAAGFAGSYIAASLYGNGHEVIGLMRKSPHGACPFRVLVHDLSQPFEIAESIDAIVHTAGAHPGSTVAQLKRDNIDTMQNIVAFARRHMIPKVIYLSTISIYGTVQSDFINEDTDIINPNVYDVTKYLAERLLLEQTGIHGICLRLPGIFGYGATKSWLVNITKQICADRGVTIYAPDFLSNNFVYVKDLANFVGLLLSKENTESIYLLGAQQRITVLDLVYGIKQQARSSAEIHIGDAPKVPFFLDVRRAVDSGFCSTTPLEMVADYFKETPNKSHRPMQSLFP